MRKTGLFIASLLAMGCSGFDPVGSYEGMATRSGNTSRMTTDLQPDGTANAATNNFNNSQTGARVSVRRVDQTHLELDIGDSCRVRVEQSPEPNEHNAQVVVSPEQRCHLRVEGFEGDVLMSGTVTFTKDDPPSIDVMFNTQAQQGNPDRAGFVHLGYTYAFRGQRQAQ